MQMRKNLRGVLEVVTPSGTHYLSPTLSERMFLIWIFRNFRTLPLNVLTDAQRRKIENMATAYRRAEPYRCDEIIGTIEALPAKKPARAVESHHAVQAAPMRARSAGAHD